MAFLTHRQHGPRLEDKRGATVVLGAGEKQYPNAFNVDDRRVPGTRFLDLNAPTWWLQSDAFDTIIAEHVLEHATDRLAFLRHCYRIAKPGASLIVEVPHWKHHYAHGMLDHRSTFAHNSFDGQYVLDGMFVKTRVEYRLFTDLDLWLSWEPLGRFLARHTGMVSGLRFYLRVVKGPDE